MSKLTLLLRNSSRLFENIIDKVRFREVKSVPAISSAFETSDLTAFSSDISLLEQQLKCAKMDLVKQINANHETLLERLNALESLVQQSGIVSSSGDQVVHKIDPPTEAEVEAERQRLTAENGELRKQVDSLVRQLTNFEIAVKGKDKVASLDLLPKREAAVCSKPLQPSSEATPAPQAAPTKKPIPPQETTASTNKENQAPKQQERKQKQPKPEGEAKPKPAKAPAKPVEPEKDIDASRLDLRVGRIIDVQKHPDADSLYVEKIECGEENPRTVVSGLVKFVPIEQMQNRLVVILCNLKPAKMRGVLSEAMVMCASTPEKVEILTPPEGAVPGDRVTFEKYPGTPDSQLNPKKKIWEQIAPDLSTNDSLLATYKGDPFVVSGKGAVKSETLKNVVVK